MTKVIHHLAKFWQVFLNNGRVHLYINKLAADLRIFFVWANIFILFPISCAFFANALPGLLRGASGRGLNGSFDKHIFV